MNFIDGIFFFYIFVGLYMTSLMLFIYLNNRGRMFDYPKGKLEHVSIIIPCFNAEKSIGNTIESVLNFDYPKDMIEIIIVDDRSTDNSVEVVRSYQKSFKNINLIVNKRNSGGAAEPTNIGIKNSNYEYIAVVDSDSEPEKDALRKMMGFLQTDNKVGGVTCAVLSKKPERFIQKMQEIEYIVIAWTRKLLDFIDSVYVTPGPFAVYRKDVLIKIGLFDTKNMTQDIEIVWRMYSKGYKARMCLDARVYSETPETIRKWLRQRIRWNIGGKQTLWKYKELIFRRGMLGLFIIPFFGFSLFLGFFGFGIFTYLLFRKFLVLYLSTKYSLYANSAILHMQELSFAPSILNFLGVMLFLSGLAFTFASLISLKYENKSIFNILFYSLVYITTYPLILIASSYTMIRGRYKW